MKFLDVRRPTCLEKLKELDKIDMLIPEGRLIINPHTAYYSNRAYEMRESCK